MTRVNCVVCDYCNEEIETIDNNHRAAIFQVTATPMFHAMERDPDVSRGRVLLKQHICSSCITEKGIKTDGWYSIAKVKEDRASKMTSEELLQAALEALRGEIMEDMAP